MGQAPLTLARGGYREPLATMARAGGREAAHGAQPAHAHRPLATLHRALAAPWPRPMPVLRWDSSKDQMGLRTRLETPAPHALTLNFSMDLRGMIVVVLIVLPGNFKIRNGGNLGFWGKSGGRTGGPTTPLHSDIW